MQGRHSLSQIILLSGALVGCGESTAPTKGPPFDEFISVLAVTQCEKIFSCCTDAQRAVRFSEFASPVTTVAECGRALEGWYGEDTYVIRAVAEGKNFYDDTMASSCLDTVRSQSCMEFDLRLRASACRHVFTGQIADGEACKSFAECRSACFWPDDLPVGTCIAFAGLGESCSGEGRFCGPDLVCGESGVCGAIAGSGGGCTLDQECESFHCELDDLGEGRCAAVRPVCPVEGPRPVATP